MESRRAEADADMRTNLLALPGYESCSGTCKVSDLRSTKEHPRLYGAGEELHPSPQSIRPSPLRGGPGTRAAGRGHPASGVQHIQEPMTPAGSRRAALPRRPHQPPRGGRPERPPPHAAVTIPNQRDGHPPGRVTRGHSPYPPPQHRGGYPHPGVGGRLDLTLASNDLAAGATWRVHPTLTSDHFATLTTLPVAPPAPPLPPPRWNIGIADRASFQASLDEWWAAYQPPVDLHQQERDLTAAIERAANAAIPRKAPSPCHWPNWWLYNEEVRGHNHRVNIHRKLYKRRANPTNLRLLQDLEAERLVAEFTARGSSDQLPGSTRRLQQQLRPRRDTAIEEATKKAEVTDRPFIPQELERAKRRGRDAAAGADGVTYSMIAHAGPAGDAALLATVNESWMAGCLPPSWKEADIQPIPKPREPTKLRPISLLSCTAKTAERMVLARLQWRVGPLRPHVFGYTRGRSTVDSILTLLNQVNHRPAIVVFLDLEKTFELASPHAILAALVRKGVMGRMLAWLRDYLQHRRAKVKFQGLKSSFQRLENGTPQGGILSPLLFNLLMEQLVALPFYNGTILLSYADDLALVVTGRGNKLRKVQQALDIISGKCEELGLKISAEKSRVMMVRAADPAGQLCVQGIRLAWANSYQYLGVWVDKWLSFIAHAAHLRERTQARLNVMRAMYFVLAVRSLVDYIAPVLISLSRSQQERLEMLQNTAMRTMLGAPRWTTEKAHEGAAYINLGKMKEV
ncbi:uncharacterized protein LOC143027414 [Oratosquilla oratoria]|uniref:uncharacterized protein LOC143027414 n=1 Tax=Oratosquilla oratoria TaxID=337810 RepID=UPI003F76EF3E